MNAWNVYKLGYSVKHYLILGMLAENDRPVIWIAEQLEKSRQLVTNDMNILVKRGDITILPRKVGVPTRGYRITMHGRSQLRKMNQSEN